MAKTLGEENSPMEEEDEVILLEDENVNNTHKEPPKIHRLEESVVNRIAAGEVIQRPVNAVKELIENSLDAGSSTISVAVKDGGLKLIQVSDDGHGIRFEDLPILCERHTTSKLSKFEDLLTIQSMGFRGEALASMTYVGHVTVTTITPGELHGYRVSYRDGVMEHEPKPCAAVKGTQIMIENLFYNMTARRKTLQNSADDYSKIVDLLSRFAIHHINVGISCRKHGAGRADVHTVATSSQLDAIRSVYGVSVARNLIKIEASDNDPSGSVFDMKGFISDSNYVAKKITMVLFINDRLVECSPLKRAIEIVYAATLPKASKPFVYMSIKLPSEHVDVNIHPTKREVSLLNQEVIIEKIQSEVELQLINSNETRTFQEQVMQPSPSLLTRTSKDIHASSSVPGGAASTSKLEKVPVNKMVRTSSQDPAGRLHAYMQVKPSSQLERNTSLNSIRSSIRQRRNPRESADLTSIQELIDEIDNNCHSGLLDIVKDCTYVGMADDEFALLQYKTHLYLANVVNLSKELMYQQVLRRFAHFNAIQLSDPAPLPDLIMLALKEEGLDADCSEDDNLKEKIAEMNTELLKEKAVMLEEYFCIYIDPQGNLSRLPVILDQYTPDMDRVPEFALCLGNDVDWDDEKSCFQTISAALANFYAMHPPMLPNPSGEGLEHYKRKSATVSPGEESSLKKSDANAVAQNEIEHELLAEAETAWAQREWSVQHVLFPAMRLFLKPTNLMAKNGTFVQICVHIPDNEGLARCGKSCRLRWVNYLRPDLKRGNFTPQEEETIIKLHEELGNKWSKIASKFPGRTDNEIKNVWNTHLKKRLKAKESKKKSQDSCHSPPTSTSTDEEVLNGSSKDECSEQNLVNQTKSVDETIEHSTSSSASCTSQELFLDQEMEDLTPLLDDLGVLSPIMVENTSNKDDASAILDKGNKSNPLEELIEIPFEPNLDLWDLLDGGVQSNSADFSDVHFNEVDTPLNLVPDIDNNNNNNNNNDNASNIDVNNTENGGSWWWLVYLENELGLEHNQATSAAQSSSTIGSNQQGSLIQGS